ncbi:hypothetical protein F5Y14DRAFT_421007 [Nemania sp. NC0429]|nr:hypothetical protein F5Y14DRAFT_421007 [Nemania sp. NC0429]
MQRVTFQRPPPLQAGPLTEVSPEYVRTPYPSYGFPSPSPSSLSASTIDDQRIYYLSQGRAPLRLAEEISDFLRPWSPPEKLDIHCSCTLLTVDSQWELHLPHPLVHLSGPTRLVHAYHIYVRFRPGGPNVDKWGDIVEGLRKRVLSRHEELLDAAIELALLREDGSVSAWYPPKLDKGKLMAYFEGSADLDDSDSAAEDGEDRGESLEVPTRPRHKRKAPTTTTTSNGAAAAALPVLRIQAPEDMDGPRNF